MTHEDRARLIKELRESEWHYQIAGFQIIVFGTATHRWRLTLLGDGSHQNTVELLADNFLDGFDEALTLAVRALIKQEAT